MALARALARQCSMCEAKPNPCYRVVMSVATGGPKRPPVPPRRLIRFWVFPDRNMGVAPALRTGRSISRRPVQKPGWGGPDPALRVWVAEQQEVHGTDHPVTRTSCSCVTQTCKATSGPPRRIQRSWGCCSNHSETFGGVVLLLCSDFSRQ